MVWTGGARCSVVVLFGKFIHAGYRCSSRQILKLSNKRGVCEREGVEDEGCMCIRKMISQVFCLCASW